jgi:hypothetical protein
MALSLETFLVIPGAAKRRPGIHSAVTLDDGFRIGASARLVRNDTQKSSAKHNGHSHG